MITRLGVLAVTGILLLAGSGVANAQADTRAGTGSKTPPAPQELPLRLRDAIEVALGTNIQVRLQLARLQQAKAQSATQLGALAPTLSATVNGNNQKFFLGQIGSSPVATNAFDIYDVRGTFSHNLFSLSLIDRWKASQRGVDAANHDTETTKRDTAATVSLLYLETLRAESLYEASQANVRLDTELLTLAQNRQAAGAATALDAARAQSQLEHEKQRLLALKVDVERTHLSLIRALGVAFDVRLKLTDRLRVLEIPALTPDEALQAAMQNRTELKAQQQRVRLASLTLDSTTKERYPSLIARGDVGLIGNRSDGTVETHNAGLMLTVPLFDGQREGRILESRSQINQELLRLQDVTDQITLEVRQAVVTLEPTRDQVSVAQRGLAAALREMELARERFVILASSNIELTNAQASLSRARDNWIEALFRYNAARVNLARAQGRLEDLY